MSRALAKAACTECGRQTVGYKTCDRCRAYRREWIAKRRAELRGKCCTVCRGKLAKTSENLCDRHLAEQGETKRSTYERRRRDRKCTRCGASALRGKALCATHAAAQARAKEKSRRQKPRARKTPQNANAREVVT